MRITDIWAQVSWQAYCPLRSRAVPSGSCVTYGLSSTAADARRRYRSRRRVSASAATSRRGRSPAVANLRPSRGSETLFNQSLDRILGQVPSGKTRQDEACNEDRDTDRERAAADPEQLVEFVLKQQRRGRRNSDETPRSALGNARRAHRHPGYGMDGDPDRIARPTDDVFFQHPDRDPFPGTEMDLAYERAARGGRRGFQSSAPHLPWPWRRGSRYAACPCTQHLLNPRMTLSPPSCATSR
jgi:hypothetical protein